MTLNYGWYDVEKC